MNVPNVTQREGKGMFFRRLFQASPAPLLIIKPDTPRFTIVEVNDSYLAATMRRREELVGRGIFEAFPGNPQDPGVAGVSALRASLDRVLATHQPDTVTGLRYDVARPDGTFEERWWSPVNSAVLGENGEVQAIIHNANDVTEQFRAEARLRHSEERLELALQAMDLAVYEWDLVSDRVIANERFKEMVGIGPDEPALGAHILEHCVHPDDRARIDSDLGRAMDANSSGQFGFEHRLSRPHERGERWVLSHGRVYFDEPSGNRRPVRVIGTLKDITDRKQAELKLREAEARQRHLIGSWAQAVWETDADGLVVADSPSWRAYTGQTLKEWMGYGWLDAIHPDDRAYAERQWREAVAVRGLVDAEFRLRAPDGGWRWTNVRATPLLDAEGRIAKWAGMNVDIDGRKRAETALRESVERYRTLFQSMDEGFCVIEMLFDPQGQPNDYRFLELNPVFKEQARVAISPGQRIREIAPDHEQFWFDIYGRIALTGEPARFEHHAAAFGGDYDLYAFRVDEPAQRRVAVLFRDITQRKRAEKELRYRSEQFETLIQQAPIGVYLVDSEFRIAQVNPVAQAVFGEMPELIGSDFDKVIHVLWDKPYADEVAALFRRTLETGEPHHTPERAEFRADRGRIEYYAWSINRITLPTGRYGVVCYFSDVSEQVRARRAIAESEQKYRTLSKSLETADVRKNEFLATLAHELRNPLAPLRTGLGILEQIGESSAHAVRTREMMERQLTHMVRLVDELLDVARVSQGKVELKKSVHTLESVVELALETSRPLLDAAGHHVQVDLPREPVLLMVDATRIAQVLTNILNNAAKYARGAGQVRLLAERPTPDRVRLHVQDNGIGIPSDMLESVFDLFTQVGCDSGRTQGGLGIGLALSRRLVELHGGTLCASSAGPGQGSTFTVELPAMRPRLPDDMPEGAGDAASVPKVGHKSVLVVDDNVDAATMLAMSLSLDGHDVHVVHTGNDALSAFGADEAPDVVFLDIGLPDRSGYEVAQELRLRRAYDHTVLVALTGWGDDRDQQRAREAGFDAHLTKPASPDALVQALASSRPPTQVG